MNTRTRTVSRWLKEISNEEQAAAQQAAEQARFAAVQAQQAAEQARLAAEEKAQRLAAKLRELDIDPDNLKSND